MEYFASFGTAMVPTMGLHKSVLHVLSKRYAIYPKARQNSDTLAKFVNAYFFSAPGGIITIQNYEYYFKHRCLKKKRINVHILLASWNGGLGERAGPDHPNLGDPCPQALQAFSVLPQQTDYILQDL